MTLLISTVAAVIATLVWYTKKSHNKNYSLGILCFMYWGASIMWLGDGIIEYLELGAKYFRPSIKDMANDIFLGLSAVTLGLVIWLVVFLINDPKGVIRNTVKDKEN